MAADKQPRLLGVDNEMVVPVNKVIRVQTTGADVIHAFAVPAFGITQAVGHGAPGRRGRPATQDAGS